MSMAEKSLQEGGLQSPAHDLRQRTKEVMEQLRCAGLLEGLLQGLEWGHLQGRRAMLVEQLQTKFGGVDEQVRCRLQEAELEDFKRYAQRILTAATLDEVFAGQEE